jgi:prolipoprotein diacylglyceryltransferase
MWPTLISFGPVYLHSFGVCLFLGVFFGAFKLWRRAREEGWDETVVLDSWLLAGVGALILGRLGFVLTHWTDFGSNWYKIVFFTRYPGLSGETAWLGAAGILLAAAGLKKLPLGLWAEAAVSALLTAGMFISLGNFLAGSELGRVAPTGWGVHFPGVEEARLPVQLFWLAGQFLLLVLINVWEKHYRSWGWQEGGLAAVYLLLNGILAAGLSFLEAGAEFGPWWGLGQAAGGGLLLWRLSGIKIKAPVKAAAPARKKRGFDYV